MTRDKLEKMLGNKVMITLFDNEIITGELNKTRENVFKNNIYYYVAYENEKKWIEVSCLFRASHVKKCIKIS